MIKFIDSCSFQNYGGWKCDTQFAHENGLSYLIADSHPVGTPVKNADTTFSVNKDGVYRVWIRTKNWIVGSNPGIINFAVDNVELSQSVGNYPIVNWYWQICGDVELKKGEHLLSAIDKTGWYSRFSSVIITDDMDFIPEKEKESLLKQRAQLLSLDLTPKDCGKYDFLVAGGGPAGIPAAIAAARLGLKVCIVQQREVIGGNAAEVSNIGFDGAACSHDNAHETGIVMELKQLHYKKGLTWQEAMEYLIAKEPNITVFVNEFICKADVLNNRIVSAYSVNTLTGLYSLYSATLFADCTGDGWLGYYAGALYRCGREAKWQFDEEFAEDYADTLTMSGCASGISPNTGKQHFGFNAGEIDKEVDFTAPEWAFHLPEGDKLNRPVGKFDSGEWWLETPCNYDDIWEQEYVRDSMIRLNLGYFNWLKNSYSKKEKVKKYQLNSIMLFNAKRESRRFIGDYMLNQNDLTGINNFEDTVAYTGWRIDIHNNEGIFSQNKGMFEHNAETPISPIPYRCLYSKNIENMYMAGRNISVSHIALGTTRVEGTCALMGEAIGTAASLCIKKNIMPRILLKDIDELQQILLTNDVTIPWISDKNYLTESNDISFSTYGMIKSDGCFTANTASESSLIVSFKETVITELRFNTVIDLTLPRYAYFEYFSDPNMIKSVTVSALVNGEWKEVKTINDNCKRQLRIPFEDIKTESIKISILDTYGGTNPSIEKLRIFKLDN